MKTKTIKTVVFAALFAAMILPFSGMQSVHAVHESDEEHGANETPVEVIPEGESEMEVIPDDSDGPDGSHGPGTIVIPDDSDGPDGSHGPVGEVIPEGESEMEVIPEGESQMELPIETSDTEI